MYTTVVEWYTCNARNIQWHESFESDLKMVINAILIHSLSINNIPLPLRSSLISLRSSHRTIFADWILSDEEAHHIWNAHRDVHEKHPIIRSRRLSKKPLPSKEAIGNFLSESLGVGRSPEKAVEVITDFYRELSVVYQKVLTDTVRIFLEKIPDTEEFAVLSRLLEISGE